MFEKLKLLNYVDLEQLKELKDKVAPYFTPEAELLNGRVAMLGMAILILKSIHLL